MTRDEAIIYGKEQLEIFGGQHQEFIRRAIEALNRPQGKWIITNPRYLHSICNYCGYYNVDSPSFLYCPNCGADMRGESDDKG